MKNQFILLLLLINLAACDVFRPAARRTDNLSSGGTKTSNGNSQPRFIQDISTDSPESVSKPMEKPLYREVSAKTTIPISGNEGYDPLQFKYAILTNTAVEDLNNPRLLLFMDQWYGVPYHYGGKSKDGIDCSAFTCQLISEVYNVNQLPRMSADQYKASRRIPKKDLREGDLVFFHTMGKGHKVTHVGVYLYNNRFVHASVAGSRSVTWGKVITCIIMLVRDESLQNDGLTQFLSFSHFIHKQFRYKGDQTAKSSHLHHFHLIGTVFSVALLPLLMGDLNFH